jgi:DNA-binding IclR family transcriptional regulator
MNKKLALLRFLTLRRAWFGAAELARELSIKPGSVSPFLTDLQQAELVKQRVGPDGGLQYASRLKFEEPE